MFKGFSFKLALALFVALALVGLATTAPAFAQGGTSGESAPETPPAGGQHITYAAFTGAPTIVDGQNRFWAWNENVSGQNVLHIRTTTDGSSHTFTGVVNTAGGGNFYNLALVNADGDDSATMVPYNQFTFSIVSSAGQTGVDVDWSGRWLSLDLNLDGYPRPAKVLYGPSATAATDLPLIVVTRDSGLLTLSLSTLDGASMFQKNIADGYFLYRTTDANGKHIYHMRLTTTKQGDIKDYKGNILADDGKYGGIHIYKGDQRDYGNGSPGEDAERRRERAAPRRCRGRCAWRWCRP